MRKRRKKKGLKRKTKLFIIILIILIVSLVCLFVFKPFSKKNQEVKTKVVDSIDNFNYSLDERDTQLMKNTYKELKEVLKEKELNYEEYAKILAKLFVIDLFTIDNKVNKYDVGSLEYILPTSIDSFKANVEDTIYKTVENNSDNKRNQKLPIVKSVEIKNVEETEYTLGTEEEGEKYAGYKVNLTWQYESDLGYDDKAEIILVKQDKKLYVTSYNPGDADE